MNFSEQHPMLLTPLPQEHAPVPFQAKQWMIQCIVFAWPHFCVTAPFTWCILHISPPPPKKNEHEQEKNKNKNENNTEKNEPQKKLKNQTKGTMPHSNIRNYRPPKKKTSPTPLWPRPGHWTSSGQLPVAPLSSKAEQFELFLGEIYEKKTLTWNWTKTPKIKHEISRSLS